MVNAMKRIWDWKIKRSAGTMTIYGRERTGQAVRLTQIHEIWVEGPSVFAIDIGDERVELMCGGRLGRDLVGKPEGRRDHIMAGVA